MTVHQNPPSLVSDLIAGFREWLIQRRNSSAMVRLDRASFDAIARELRVTPGDLDELVSKGPHAADELPRLLKALGISDADLAGVQPSLRNDMERLCCLCLQKGKCRSHLNAGTSAAHYREYCPNASTIDALDGANGAG